MRQLLIAGFIMTFASNALADDAAAHVQAKSHYEAGERAFRLGEMERAVKEFKTAYDLAPVPLLLYNVAQAYRQMGDTKQALFFYQQFLAAGATGDAKRVAEQRVEEVKVALETQKRAQEAPPTGMASATPLPPTNVAESRIATSRSPTENELHSARTLKIAGYVTGGFGVVALGVGGLFTGLASNANGHIVTGNSWAPATEDQRNTFQVLDATFFAIGGAALAVGVTLYLVGRHNERRFYPNETNKTTAARSIASESSVIEGL